MQTTAGNEYQGLSIDNIAITVFATQDTVESDSFSNTYDENADMTPDNLDKLLLVNLTAPVAKDVEGNITDTIISNTVDEDINLRIRTLLSRLKFPQQQLTRMFRSLKLPLLRKLPHLQESPFPPIRV